MLQVNERTKFALVVSLLAKLISGKKWSILNQRGSTALYKMFMWLTDRKEHKTKKKTSMNTRDVKILLSDIVFRCPLRANSGRRHLILVKSGVVRLVRVASGKFQHGVAFQ